MPADSSAGIKNFFTSSEKGSCSVVTAAVLTFCCTRNFASSAPSRSGIAEVVNQMLPGLTSRIATDAAELPTSGNWYFSRMPVIAKWNGVPHGASRRSTLSSVISFS